MLLFLGLVNYAYSFAFWHNYSDYLQRETVLENPGCLIPGLSVLASYSMFLVMVVGSLVLGIFTLAFLFKLSFLLSVLICPISVTNCRKKRRDIPLDFEHYVNEFNFSVGDDEEPECHPEEPELCLAIAPNSKKSKISHQKKPSGV